ncbi:MAG TPA: DUF4301 family protein [Deltaproteobacteria bacterium]|nr:DUF4301 family protein [Deltaproteobacteria bacterium]
MNESIFDEKDMNQMKNRGISLEKVISQIKMFEKGTPYVNLNQPCTIGNGIRSVTEDELKKLISIFEEYAPKKRLTKFVPASGAASRMFKILLRFNNEFSMIQRDIIASEAQEENGDRLYMITFMDGIRKFAFYDDLKAVMAGDGIDSEALVDSGQFKEIIDYLLTRKGLSNAQLPKGLLKFHNYHDSNRTAFEEHLVEAADYAKDENGICNLHFTVSPEHKKKFEAFLDRVRMRYEQDYGVRFRVGFSVQEKSTDTIAVDLDNKPFRLNDGALLFRPSGHGALIENLNNLQEDIIFIKNVDNVAPDKLNEQIFQWKKMLGGYLIKTQQKIFSYIKRLCAGTVNTELLQQAFKFAVNELCVSPSANRNLRSNQAKKDFLISVFNRPIRVCGMVKNTGEPGGGPFWVEAEDGSLSIQIVENAQVNPESKEQQEILSSSSHSNPVDIVCAVRDFKGNSFDLRQYVDTGAVFIAHKSKDGNKLKALELPGLWNGAMAYWNTIFVEVPLITFNPVKTVNDLLRKEHQLG